jgi:putative transposase
VDTQGWVLRCKVHPADGMDLDGVMQLLPPEQTKAQLPRLSQVWLDAGYNGKDKGQDWIEKELGWTTQVVRLPSRRVVVAAEAEPTPRPAFTVLPRRWVVERSLAWLGQSRRLSKDSERLSESSEAMVYAAMVRLMVRHLVPIRITPFWYTPGDEASYNKETATAPGGGESRHGQLPDRG